jgi:hypothetical protein
MDAMPSPIDLFRTRRKLWLDCLTGSDSNSVKNQVQRIIWNAATFRVINEARRIASTDKDGRPKLSGLEHEMINNGFFAYQAIAVRRLGDSYPLEGPKGVYSLAGLLKDIKSHARLFTRKNMIETERAMPSYPEFYVDVRHEQIDEMSGVKQPQRADEDTIQIRIFDRLLARLKEASNDVSQHVDQYLAHAATPESRASRKTDDLSITLQHHYDAHRVICEIVNFVSVWLLNDTHLGFFAIPQFNQFEYMDSPLVETQKIQHLRAIWDDFKREINGWSDWGWDGLKSELDAPAQGICKDETAT